jgi:hypothetical protein
VLKIISCFAILFQIDVKDCAVYSYIGDPDPFAAAAPTVYVSMLCCLFAIARSSIVIIF